MYFVWISGCVFVLDFLHAQFLIHLYMCVCMCLCLSVCYMYVFVFVFMFLSVCLCIWKRINMWTFFVVKLDWKHNLRRSEALSLKPKDLKVSALFISCRNYIGLQFTYTGYFIDIWFHFISLDFGRIGLKHL